MYNKRRTYNVQQCAPAARDSVVTCYRIVNIVNCNKRINEIVVWRSMPILGLCFFDIEENNWKNLCSAVHIFTDYATGHDSVIHARTRTRYFSIRCLQIVNYIRLWTFNIVRHLLYIRTFSVCVNERLDAWASVPGVLACFRSSCAIRYESWCLEVMMVGIGASRNLHGHPKVGG